jgi:hypothetical protein
VLEKLMKNKNQKKSLEKAQALKEKKRKKCHSAVCHSLKCCGSINGLTRLVLVQPFPAFQLG